jgi:pimeloyl-ACP methyl ester carboxylesterase
LISPYTSITEMGSIAFPYLPARLLTRDVFDTAEKAPHVAIPVLILHGAGDEVIPVAMGERLAKLFPNAQLVLIPGASHNDIFESEALGRGLGFSRN